MRPQTTLDLLLALAEALEPEIPPEARRACQEVFSPLYGEALTRHPGLLARQAALALHAKLLAARVLYEARGLSLEAASPAGLHRGLDDGTLFESLGLHGFPGHDPLAACLAGAGERVWDHVQALWQAPPPTAADPFRTLYEGLLPRPLRHVLGEYHTPAWLAAHLVEVAGHDGDPRLRVLDPACGAGALLVQVVRRVLRDGVPASPLDAADLGRHLLDNLRGLDLNPLAVLLARVNLLRALAPLLPHLADLELPVFVADALFPAPGEAERPRDRDLVIGNPPWLRWGELSPEARARTLPLWRRYGLFSLDSRQARLGGGEKDLSMLFTLACADRFTRPGGLLCFAATYELFSSKGAGGGFRRFHVGDQGPALGVERVEDLSALHPFDAANKTCLFRMRVGAPTHYPVPLLRWRTADTRRRRAEEKHVLSDFAVSDALVAEPSDDGDPCSSWQVGRPRDLARWRRMRGSNPYGPLLGLRVEPYGVFWIEVLEVRPDGLLRVANRPELGKRRFPRVEALLEPTLLYPAVAGSSVGAFEVRSSFPILMTQDPQTRRPRTEAWMRAHAPLTLEYLRAFEAALLSRGSRVVRELALRTEPWAMYAVSEASFAPFRVAWKRMASRMEALVLSDTDTPWGRRPMLCTDTLSFIPVDQRDEAHYLCALLNTRVVDGLVRGVSSAGRGFGAPSVLRNLAIPLFDRENVLHRRLAALSEEAHEARPRKRGLDTILPALDACGEALWETSLASQEEGPP